MAELGDAGGHLVQWPITSWTVSIVAEDREVEVTPFSRLHNTTERGWIWILVCGLRIQCYFYALHKSHQAYKCLHFANDHDDQRGQAHWLKSMPSRRGNRLGAGKCWRRNTCFKSKTGVLIIFNFLPTHLWKWEQFLLDDATYCKALKRLYENSKSYPTTQGAEAGRSLWVCLVCIVSSSQSQLHSKTLP